MTVHRHGRLGFRSTVSVVASAMMALLAAWAVPGAAIEDAAGVDPAARSEVDASGLIVGALATDPVDVGAWEPAPVDSIEPSVDVDPTAKEIDVSGQTIAAHLKSGLSAASVWQTPADATATWHLSPIDEFGSRRVFRVLEAHGEWLYVQVPVRPNGTTGWIRTVDVELSGLSHRIEVDLSERTVSVFDGDELVIETVGAIGRPGTPTPTGSFFLRSAFAWDPDSVYGPYVLALSAFSESIEQINGGDAVVAIHGTQRSDQLGQAVSLGCVRLDNDDITRIAHSVPVGTPVDIVA